MGYDPARSHRRSIRLKGHDYAGGGVYFVTICAHREIIAATRGSPFGRLGDPSPMRDLIEERMRITAEKCPGLEWLAHVVMPDHFHALVRMPSGFMRLGDVIGGFKAAVSRESRRGDTCVARTCVARTCVARTCVARTCVARTCVARTCVAPACVARNNVAQPRIWHRNYYECIVRSPEA